MGWLNDWRKRRVRRRFKALGADCVFSGVNYDLKGRVEAGVGCKFGGNLVLRTHKGGRIAFGNNVEVADYVLVQVNAGLTVGDDTYIGPYTVLRDTNHHFQGADIHWRLMPHITEPIVVGKGCYIGPGCYIMPGVTIGDGAVIAPMSVVHKNVPPLEVWSGAPASRIAHRTDATKLSSQRKAQEIAALFGFEPNTTAATASE